MRLQWQCVNVSESGAVKRKFWVARSYGTQTRHSNNMLTKRTHDSPSFLCHLYSYFTSIFLSFSSDIVLIEIPVSDVKRSPRV